MLRTALLIAAIVVGQAAPGVATFRDESLRLAFDHPDTWKVGKRVRDTVAMTMPIEGTTDLAKLEVTRAVFRDTPDIWQLIQTHANKQLRREVVRQWRQEVLGVPMLLTKIAYVEGGTPVNTVTGLLYTATPQKLLFRLTGPAQDFDKVEFMFQTAVETLRTLDDQALAPEDPNRPLPVVDPTKKPELKPPKRTTFETKPSQTESVLGPVSAELDVMGRKVALRAPEGWTIEDIQGESAVLRHPKVASPVEVKLFAQVAADPPKNALFGIATESLNAMRKVLKRDDVVDRKTRGTMVLNAVWRRGETATGQLTALDAAVAGLEHYALVRYQSSEPSNFVSERRLIEGLLDVLSVAVQP